MIQLAFLKEFCENYPRGARGRRTTTSGEFMKREKTPFPAVPTNAAEAPDDADWSIASSKKSAAQRQHRRRPWTSTPRPPRGRHRVPPATTPAKRAGPVETGAAGGGHQRLRRGSEAQSGLVPRAEDAGKVRAALGEFVEATST